MQVQVIFRLEILYEWEKFGREKKNILTFKNLCATWRIRQNEVGSHNKKEIVSAEEAANIHEVFSTQQNILVCSF